MHPVASFTIVRTEIVRADGSLAGKLPAFAESRAELVRLYRAMVLTRAFDAKAIALQRTGQLGTFPRRSARRPWWSGSVPRCGPRMCCCRPFASTARSSGAASPSWKLLSYWGGDERGS